MKVISNDDLKEILRKHILWLRGDPYGEKENLREADLRWADLRWADLYGANDLRLPIA